MLDKEVLSQIELMEAHAREILKIAERLRLKLQPVSTGRKKNEGISDSEIARLIARKNRRRNNQT